MHLSLYYANLKRSDHTFRNNEFLKNMAVFDTAHERWNAIAKTPYCGRAYHTATLVGTKIWVVGPHLLL